MLPLQMEKKILRQAEAMKNQKTSLRAGKGKRQVVTYAGVSWQRAFVVATNECLFIGCLRGVDGLLSLWIEP